MASTLMIFETYGGVGTEMKNEISVRLTVTGFADPPSTITDILKVEPSRTWMKGDLIDKRTIATRKENGWCLEALTGNDASLDEQIQTLIDLLEPKKENFRKLAADCCVELSCSVYVADKPPELHLSNAVIDFLQAIGAEFDLDLYCLTTV